MFHKAIPVPPTPGVLRELDISIIADTIERLIAELDKRAGDPDLEDSEAGETAIDDRGRQLFDMSWATTEDDEDGDPAEDDDPAEEDDPLELNGDEGDHSGDPHA
jgi:hypothetical protein